MWKPFACEREIYIFVHLCDMFQLTVTVTFNFLA